MLQKGYLGELTSIRTLRFCIILQSKGTKFYVSELLDIILLNMECNFIFFIFLLYYLSNPVQVVLIYFTQNTELSDRMTANAVVLPQRNSSRVLPQCIDLNLTKKRLNEFIDLEFFHCHQRYWHLTKLNVDGSGLYHTD